MQTKDFKIPPQDLDAERSVLGALLLDKNAVIRIADTLSASDFYHPANQKIYETILEIFEKGEPIDMLTVTNRLKEKKMLKDVGGIDYLTELVAQVPTSAHVSSLITVSAAINEQAFEHKDFETLIDNVEQKIFGISQRSRQQKFIQIKEELPIAYERLEKLHRGERGLFRGLPTHFPQLDNLLSGLQQSDLIILGARPSYGKTTFALDIARQVALSGKSVGIFSIEMSRDQVVDRLIAAQAQIPLWRLRTGRLNDELEFALVQQALDELSKVSLHIDDSASPTLLQMRSMARRLQIEHGLDLLVVDYLQLIQPRTGIESMVHQVTEISRGLKALARELSIPVLAISQLSREVDKRDIKIPRLSDLRESGSLEQDADVVLFIYRKDRDRSIEITDDEQNTVEIIIAKHRNGPLGSIQLKFDQERVSFRTIDTVHAGGEEISSQ